MSDEPKPGEQANPETPKVVEGQPPKPAEGAPAGEQKKGEEAPKAPVVPDKYDLKLGEGSVLDAKRIEEVAAFAKARGLSNEQAQAILDRDDASTKAQRDEVAKRQEQWYQESEADKEIGGTPENFKANAELAKRVIARFGTPELATMLNETKLGNNKEAIRVFARIGKAMTEDQFVTPGTASGEKKTLEELFYPEKAAAK